jgi:phage tail-like protein
VAIARVDPYLAFAFLVEVEGVASAGFHEVTGLTAELEVLDYREGGVNEYVHRLPGPARYPSNLVLRRGLTDAVELWDWWLAASQGWIERRNVSVLLLGRERDVVRRWSFLGAYPVRWVGPELRAGSPAVALEAFELAHRGMGGAP